MEDSLQTTHSPNDGSGVTQEDLIQAVINALSQPDDSDGATAREIAKGCGVGIRRAREAIRSLKRQGLVTSGRRREEDISGRLIPIPVYRLVTNGDK